MRRILWVGAIWAAVFGCAGSAQAAIELTITYTGDNVVSAFYKNGADPERVDIAASPYNGDWKLADTVTVPELKHETTYQFFFQVHNEGPAGRWNPAAFLAEISGRAVGDPSSLTTSSSWDYAVDLSKGGASTPPPEGWAPATEWSYYRTAGAPVDIEGSSSKDFNGESSLTKEIEGISSEARWIWGPHNGAELAEYSDENFLWLRATIRTGAPEPSTLLIWSLLALSGTGLSIWRRRRAGQWGGAGAARAAWPEENRQAIHRIIARKGLR